jgi:hypothetical protein
MASARRAPTIGRRKSRVKNAGAAMHRKGPWDKIAPPAPPVRIAFRLRPRAIDERRSAKITAASRILP